MVKAFAFRGAMHYLSPEDGGAYLAIRCAGRQWELPSWVEYYELAADDWPAFRATVREVLADGPLTLAELGAGITAHRRYRNLKAVFDEGAGTLIKPLTWQGDMGFGPPRDGRHTFQRLDTNPRWKGVWELDEAGPYAVEQYFRNHGPATYDHIHHYYGGNLAAGRKLLNGWLAGAGGPTGRGRRGGCDPLRHARRPRRADGDETVERRALPARPRPVGDGARHERRVRHADLAT